MAASNWASCRWAGDGPRLTRPKVASRRARRQPRSGSSGGVAAAAEGRAAGATTPRVAGGTRGRESRAGARVPRLAAAQPAGSAGRGGAEGGRGERVAGQWEARRPVPHRGRAGAVEGRDRTGAPPGCLAARAADGPAGIRRARSWAPRVPGGLRDKRHGPTCDAGCDQSGLVSPDAPDVRTCKLYYAGCGVEAPPESGAEHAHSTRSNVTGTPRLAFQQTFRRRPWRLGLSAMSAVMPSISGPSRGWRNRGPPAAAKFTTLPAGG